jgi:short-subunit dehydrogenase
MNSFGLFLLTQPLLHCLLQSSSPRIGLMSSRIGSIADTPSGGSYTYRASKVVLYSTGKSMAIDLKNEGVMVDLMQPEYAKTALDRSDKTHEMRETRLENYETCPWGSQ